MLRSIIGGAVSSAARRKSGGRGLLNLGIGLVATRIATRSIPGAIAVGGALLAKALWDQRERRPGGQDGDRPAGSHSAIDTPRGPAA